MKMVTKLPMTNPLIEQKVKEFVNEFVELHPGDSGAGGNYPQEPIFEVTESDPNEYIRFLRQALQEVALDTLGEVEKKIERRETFGREKPYDVGLDDGFNEQADFLLSHIASLKEQIK